MRTSALSEVFWKVVENFVEQIETQLDTFCADLMKDRAHIYSIAVQEKWSPLKTCVGFMVSMKIQNSRPGRDNTNQRICYSGNKRFHCVMYKAMTISDVIVFYLYEPEVAGRYGMSLCKIMV